MSQPSKHGPGPAARRPILDELNRLWGYIADAATTARNRRLAEEVRVLSEMVCDRNHSAPPQPQQRSRRLAVSLEETRRCLQMNLSKAPAPAKVELSWDSSCESPAAATPPLPPAAPSGSTRAAADIIDRTIDLVDWLERCREDERISPSRANDIAQRKADALLESLGLSRIQGLGAFDANQQRIVETVSTQDASLDLQVCASVQCGYRSGDRVLRPETVMIYHYEADD